MTINPAGSIPFMVHPVFSVFWSNIRLLIDSMHPTVVNRESEKKIVFTYSPRTGGAGVTVAVGFGFDGLGVGADVGSEVRSGVGSKVGLTVGLDISRIKPGNST